jgi:hypothetical protein
VFLSVLLYPDLFDEEEKIMIVERVCLMISWSLPFSGILAGASINELAIEREGAPSFFPHLSGLFLIFFPSFFVTVLNINRSQLKPTQII